MNRNLRIGALSGAIAVGIGAFGAHGLKSFLIEYGRLDTFETAVKYHFYHTLALLFIGILQLNKSSKWLNYSSNLFFTGMLIFSGTLYTLCLTNISLLGAITPIGGILLIAGWVSLFIAAIKKPELN